MYGKKECSVVGYKAYGSNSRMDFLILLIAFPTPTQ